MFLMQYFSIIALNVDFVIGSKDYFLPSENLKIIETNDNLQVSSTTQSADLQNNQIASNQNRASRIEYEKFCPICLCNLPKLKYFDLSNDQFYRRSLFKCPNEITKTFCFKCIDRWRKECTNENQNNEFSCPGCRVGLNETFEAYRKKFIKHLILNSNKKMINTLKMLLVDFDATNILEDIFKSCKINIKSCERILLWTKGSTCEQVEIFRNFLMNKLIELETEKISSNKFEDFCNKLKNNPENIQLILTQNLNFIKSLTSLQGVNLIRTVINIPNLDYLNKFNSIKILLDLVPERSFIKTAEFQDECFQMSMLFLNIASAESLELFNKLNSLLINYPKKSIVMLYEKLATLYENFKHDLIFFESIKILNLKIPTLGLKVKIFNENFPAEIILENEYNFLIQYFDEDFIFKMIENYLINYEDSFKIIDFYFSNYLYSRYPFRQKQIIEKFLKFDEYDHAKFTNFSCKEIFEYFMRKFTEYNLVEHENSKPVLELIHNTFIYGLPNYLLKPFEKLIEENLFEFSATDLFRDEDYDHLLFDLLNEFKNENKEDYQQLDLSAKFFVKRSNLSYLFKIIHRRNFFPALRTICETNELFDEFTLEDKDNLKELICEIMKHPERKILLNIIKDRIPCEYHYLFKLYLIVSIYFNNNWYTSYPENIKNEDDLRNSLLRSIAMTPKLEKEMLKDDFSIFLYLNSLNIEESKMYVENIKITYLIELTEKIGFQTQSTYFLPL